MRKSTPVREAMSRLPEEVDGRERLEAAIRRMNELHLRHLPVMDGPRLFGILSRQNVQDAWLRFGEGAKEKAVSEVCTRDLLKVEPLAPVGEVARAMLGRGITSALVVDGGVLVGIFTSVDALRLIAEG